MYPRSREKDATACSVRKSDPDQKLQAFVWSSSRNVTSMLEFALPEFVHLKKVISVEEIRENMGEKTGEDILGLFVDVSEEEDGGQARWQELGGLQREHALPMIAICKEGNLVQMKCALETEGIQDLLLAPLEANVLKRRMKIWTQN